MTPEERQLLEDLSRKLNYFIDIYQRTHLIDQDIFPNRVFFKQDVYLPSKVAFFGSNTPITKGSSVAPASGGTIVDTEARTAINTLISRVQALGLIS